jgi:NADPH-dependent 2,4-dienoyl-CoA reductase/sulfur reductase-like enzyme/nitrite reductase/ring-hydroxylating ferredoxin subunit
MGGGPQELTGPDLEQGVAYGDLSEGKPVLGHAGGEAVVLVRVGAAVHAIGASCTHYGGPLAEGFVDGHTIRCPWHHACFDLRTGEASGAPALADVACWKVERTGDLVQVRTKAARAERTPPSPATAPRSVVIVGAGAAAAACVETLRKEGYEGPITMLGAEEPGPVDRPNLSKDYLAGTAPEEWIPVGGEERWKELRADLFATSAVTSIDTANKTVLTRDGRALEYGALLYAPGAEPSRLPIAGVNLPHVFVLRTLADSRAIIERAKTAKRAVVIGASFIGLEAAASLVARGIEVHVVGREDVPLGRVLGDALGARVREIHESKGVVFHLGTAPKSIRDAAVDLANGQTLAADLVVLGVGVKPRLDLARAAGLEVDDGVVVDEQLRTSAPAVWAAGDVARHPDPRVGGHVRIEHWVVAERQGQHAARSMLGRAGPYHDAPFFWSAHHGVQIAYVGHAPGWDAVEVIGDLAKDDATVVYRRGGKPLAVATLNRDAVSLAVDAAMSRNDLAAVDRIVRS